MIRDTALNKRALLVNSASSLLSRGLSITVLVWMYQYLLRRIDPVEYSVYAVVVSVMAFSSLLTITLTSGLGRYLVEAYAQKDERRVTQLASTMAPILFGAALIALAIGGTLAVFAGKIFAIAPGHEWDARFMITLMSVMLGLQLAFAPFGLGIFVRQRFVLLNGIHIGQELLRIALLFTLLVGVGPRVIWIVVASFSATIVGLIVTQIVSRRLVPALRFRFSEMRAGLARQVMAFGVYSFLSQIAILIHNAANPLILNRLATPLDVTTLHIGAVADYHARNMSTQATAPLVPTMTALNAVNDEARLRQFYLQGCRYEMWAVLFVALPIVIFGQDFVELYVGPKFWQAGTVLALLFASHAFLFSQGFLPKIAHAKARIGAFSILTLLMSVSAALLSIVLVGRLHMGAIGAALATCTMRGLSVLVFIPLSTRVTGVGLSQWLEETVLPGLTPAVIAAAALLLLRSAYAPSSWTALGLCVAVGAGVYVISLLTLALSPEDRSLLQKVRAYWTARADRPRAAEPVSPKE